MSIENIEGIGSYGIPLCRPGEQLNEYATDFEAQPRLIPDLGEAVLSGTDDYTNIGGEDSRAVAILKDRVVTATRRDFQDHGYYELSVWLDKMGMNLTVPLICELGIPSRTLLVESGLESIDDDEERNPIKRYRARSTLWRSSATNREYVLFAPKDTQVLSLPVVHFRMTSPPVPKS